MSKKKEFSEGAKCVLNYLKAKNLIYRIEPTYTHCKDQRKLPFDFEIIINGRVGAIEFDGEQHFKRTSRFHPTVEAFEKQKLHDIIKTKYCYNNSISLLRIDYSFNCKEKMWPLLDAYVEALKSGSKGVYQFSDVSLYKQHYNACSSSWCVVM
jgi:hypothetical protein